MPDPAVEAAQRAWPGRRRLVVNRPRFHMEAAARETVKPIREKCEELEAMFGGAATDVAAGVRLALAQIAPLIYSTEELKR